MSKTAVPDVYARVIRDVCEQSRVDFEEGGVDLKALELLQQGWQKRLTDLKIASFPWDPKPEPAAKPETTSSERKAPSSALPSNSNVSTPSTNHSTPNGGIKQESQSYNGQQAANPAYSQFAQGQALSAQQRAAMHLHQRYGEQAGTQIAQLQNAGQQRVPTGQQPVQQPNQPYIKQEDNNQQDYRMTPNMGQAASVNTAQTDGPGDEHQAYETEIARRRALVAQNREAGDRLIHDHVLASQQRAEGGGLMLPLGQQPSAPQWAQRSLQGPQKSGLSRAQGDAAGDDEEDEDAINSDLDDPNDLDDNENDEDAVQEVMLCTYDKVQRVKNKWKCTLKDGVLKVDGADYVFHKGQGEFEW